MLLRRYPKEQPVTSEGNGPGQAGDAGRATTQIMDVLRDQLQSKDRQIQTLETQLDRKDQQIQNLTDRMRESNVLMAELQKKLAIAAPSPATPRDVVDSVETSKPSKEESTPKPKPAARQKSVWTRPLFPGVFDRRKE